MKNFIFLITLLLLVSCDYFKGEKPIRPYSDSLSKNYAELRKKNISDVHYKLKFDLTNREELRGEAQINFTLSNPFFLTIDFSQGVVESLFVNSKAVKKIKYKGQFIEVPQGELVQGVNSIVVNYKHTYGNSDENYGLVQFKDPLDGRFYLYSHLNYYKANRLFPNFDQPNLKATFEAEVVTPSNWVVASVVRESLKNNSGQSTRWVFPLTIKLSPHHFSLFAGEYSVWEDTYVSKKRSIPLRLLARRSLEKLLNTEDWLSLTKKGIPFFEKYYSTLFPYSKYDQVLVPQLSASSVGTAGVAIFDEKRYLSPPQESLASKRLLSIALFQEMSSMWFGSRVTMDWWSDLWLSQSFSIHSSYLAAEKVAGIEQAWSGFHSTIKQRVYPLDQSSMTHPVEMSIPNTEDILSNLDLISYGKGASLLRQLSFYLGDKSYKKGFKSYLNKFKDDNGNFEDFIQAMSEASDKNLSFWSERWLQTEMLNNIEVFFVCKKGKISTFEMFQTGTQKYPTLRTHKTKVALLNKGRNGLKANRILSVEYNGERTSVSKLVGEKCPDLVYPNWQDYDYVRVQLDAKSFKQVKQGVSRVSDDFLRNLLWGDLWQMVLNQQLDMNTFLEVVEFHGLNESNLNILTNLLLNVSTVLKNYYPRETQVWESKRQVWLKFFEQSYLAKIIEHKDNRELQKLWFDSLLEISESTEVHSKLAQLLKSKNNEMSLSFSLDTKSQHKIAKLLTGFGQSKGMEINSKDSLNSEMLKRIGASKSPQINVSTNDASVVCDQESVDRIEKLIKNEKNISSELKKGLGTVLWENQRCLQMRKKMKSSSQEYYKTI